MMPKILTTTLENWLYSNYSTMSNEQLAQELSQKIREENKKQIEELRRVLPYLPSIQTRKATLKKISRLEEFKGVNIAFIKNNAKRLQCPKKSSAYISELNRQRRAKKLLQEWESKAQLVPQPYAWFRTLQANRSYFAKFENNNQLISFRASLSNYNRCEAPTRGLFLTSDFHKENLVAKIDARPLR